MDSVFDQFPCDCVDCRNELFCSLKKCSETSTKFRKEGNLLYLSVHGEDTHMQVLSLYSKSIAFAPENSEVLALAFGNRSALLLHMQKYEECIIDIDKAVSISKSDELKTKLLARKETSKKLINEINLKKISETKICKGFAGEKVSKKLEIPKIVPSKKVPCISKGVTLRNSEKFGRHMVADKDFKPGEIIGVEEAYVGFPQPDKLYVIFSHCLSQMWNGIPCDFCSMSIYCSKNCKNLAWQEYHEIECSIVANIESICSEKPVVQLIVLEKTALRFFIKTVKSHGLENMIQEVRKKGMNYKFLNNFLLKFLQ